MPFKCPALLSLTPRTLLIIRLVSILLCIGSLLATGLSFLIYDHVYTDGMGNVTAFVAIFPGGLILLWNCIYLGLTSFPHVRHVKIPLPVVITLELMWWMYAAAIGGFVGGMTYWDHTIPCRYYRYSECEWWMRAHVAAGFTIAFSFGLMFIHFVFFLRAIREAQQIKRVPKNYEELGLRKQMPAVSASKS
ncbi:hypothetical protein CPB83DRAFT_845719 [Crepidotus variabilis]|uniref:MARVEL domain-containing protein n=1 Tax=Crepidotus variabilis TaxID=179855 RepID=A0A9P6JU32_9AGAR|nr:hypothetical protein CPB83DRAFT_845719 [Crepidotus variabilis]